MNPIRKIEKEILIKAPWGKIAALTWGSPTNPPVLLCHGKLDACSGFRPLVTLLPDCFYYVSVDLPGNGRSDHLPKGLRYTVVDLVPTLVKVMEHFQWTSFRYIGHSLGVPIGKMFNIAYPGRITRAVELDPVPAHHNWPTTRETLHDWYHQYYSSFYDDDKYIKLSGAADTAPKYTYEKARHLIMFTRGLSKEGSEQVLERCLEPAGDGLYRFTFDQRMKEVTTLPFSGDQLRQLYSSTTTPTYCFLASAMVRLGLYNHVPFLQPQLSIMLVVLKQPTLIFCWGTCLKDGIQCSLPFSGDQVRRLYASTTTPTYCFLASAMVRLGLYNHVPFLQDPSAWTAEYKYRVVEGGHDLHIDTPEAVAEDISKFLLEDVKAKL